MTWHEAFRGIEFPTQRQASGIEDMADVIARRKRNRLDNEIIRVPIRVLIDVAKRIEAQSVEIARLSGAGPALDSEALADYEAQQEAAERAAVKTGVLVRDGEIDWAALYDAKGFCVTQGHVSSVSHAVISEAWSVNAVNADGFLYDWDSDKGPGPTDYQEFPDTLAEFQRAYGAYIRVKQAEVAARLVPMEPRVPENPITGEPGAERDERSA